MKMLGRSFCMFAFHSVRPPKKSWKNIANLSGGEKTLSSLALVSCRKFRGRYNRVIIIMIIMIYNNGITQTAFPHSGSSSTWGTNGFTSLSTDGVAKEDHLNIQPHGQAGNRTRDLLASSQRSHQLS